MKYIHGTIFLVLFFAGCASGKLSVSEGDVRFAIPFDFPGPAQQGQDLREGKIAEQKQYLEKQKAQEGSSTQK